MTRLDSVALVYEISHNPLFSSEAELHVNRLTEFAKPSEINDLLTALKSKKYSVSIVDGPSGLIDSAEELLAKQAIVFNKSIGYAGLERKIHVPAICQLYGLDLIGTSAYSMTLARHKYHTNRLLQGLGYRVPHATLWCDWRRPPLTEMQYPVIIKPNHESDALGIDESAIAGDRAAAEQRATWVMETFSQSAIIEEYVSGEEWKIAVIGNGNSARAVGTVGVMRDGRAISGSLQTREDVLQDRLDYYTPGRTAALDEAERVAVDVHCDLGLRDYSRIDFRLSNDSKPVCMEVSTHPEMARSSSFSVASMQTYGVYEEVVNSVVSLAASRQQ